MNGDKPPDRGREAAENRSGDDLDGGPACQHVDFSDDAPERCGRDAERVEIGNATTFLCDDHAAKARDPAEVPA